MARLTKQNSGHENIRTMKSGNHRVIIFTDHLGTFKDINIAIKVRDEYRVKHALRPAKY
jgi:hypothetical protein